MRVLKESLLKMGLRRAQVNALASMSAANVSPENSIGHNLALTRDDISIVCCLVLLSSLRRDFVVFNCCQLPCRVDMVISLAFLPKT
jgi:hypothetical protein